MDRGMPARLKEGLQFPLPYTSLSDTAFAVGRLPDQEAAGVGLLPDFVGGAHLDESFVGPESGVLETLGFGDAPQRHSRFLQTAGNGQGGGAHTGGYGSGGLAVEVRTDDGLGIEGQAIGGRTTRSSPGGPMEARALLDASALDTGLIEPLLDPTDGHAEPSGDLGSGFTPDVSGHEVVGADVVPTLHDRLDPEHTGGFALGSEPDAGPDQPLSNRIIGGAEPSGNLADGFPADVRRDKIVGIEVGVFKGHVYNLQTEPGHYIANGILSHNCAAVPNLALRCDGKRIPFRPSFPDRRFDGGIAAYFYGSAFGAGYFTGYDEPFRLARAKRWAKETRSGVLLGKGYDGPQLSQQGHTGILLPSGFILQSRPVEGLTWDSHIDDKRERDYWSDGGVMLHPSQWFEYDQEDDVADWAKEAGEPSPGKCVGF